MSFPSSLERLTFLPQFCLISKKTGHKEQSLKWLSWLAKQMQQHALTVFYIERLQPYWLSTRQQTIFNEGCLLLVLILFQCCVGLIGGLSGGVLLGLIFALIYGLIYGLIVGLSGGLSGGLIVGLSFGLIVGLSAEIRKWFFRRLGRKPQAMSESIRIVEAVRWSWPQFFSSILPNLGYGLIFGLGIGLSFWLRGKLFGGLIGGLGIGLILGLIYGLSGGLSGDEIERKVIPNQGIKRSARNAIIYGLIVGLIVGLIWGLSDVLIFQLSNVVDLRAGLRSEHRVDRRTYSWWFGLSTAFLYSYTPCP
jgi:hypothetical protein